MKASTQRFFGLIASLFLFAVTIFVYAFLLRPAYDDVNKLRGELAAQSDALDEEQKIVAQVKDLLSRYQGIANFDQTISLSLPKREAYPTLVNQLDAIAKGSGIFLDSINLTTLPAVVPQGGKIGPSLSTLQLNLRLIGPYAGFKDFIKKLETNVRLMDIVRFSITPTLVGGNYTYVLVVNTYYQSL
jgi:Tfp pilus assembly protein PilO